MKRYDPQRADKRSIDEKALGLIFAMSEDDARSLLSKLREMSKRNSRRAKMFTGIEMEGEK